VRRRCTALPGSTPSIHDLQATVSRTHIPQPNHPTHHTTPHHTTPHHTTPHHTTPHHTTPHHTHHCSGGIFVAAALLLGPDVLVAAAVLGAAVLLAAQAGLVELQLPELPQVPGSGLVRTAVRAPLKLAGQLERRLEGQLEGIVGARPKQLPAPPTAAAPGGDEGKLQRAAELDAAIMAAERKQWDERQADEFEGVVPGGEELQQQQQTRVPAAPAPQAPSVAGSNEGSDGSEAKAEAAKRMVREALQEARERAMRFGGLAKEKAALAARAAARRGGEALESFAHRLLDM